ncbi:UNVERIFIED_CONTAM: hypothetical protein Slati_1441400 [Sesamum latifolium]|uniref:Reverse transcriptase domain-containing protein n=1 Tax=Sesamum latifolium TaxID=2727402 RepID=A0AAW2X5X7_9LAMI
MTVEEKGLLTRPRSWRDTPQRPKSDKFCHFHNDYGHTTEECKHLKNEIETLIQNGYLQEYVCWEKARGTGPYQKREGDKANENRVASPEQSLKEGARQASGRSYRGRDYGRHPLIQFGRAEQSGPRTSHNDALVITVVLANYEVGRIFVDSGSSADILFGEAYDQMQIRRCFPGEGATRKTCMLKFLVVDVPSAYNVILGRPTLNAFQVVISIYHMKIKFPTPGGVGEVQGDHLQSRKIYVEAVRKGQKRNSNEGHERIPLSKKGKKRSQKESQKR